MLGDMINKLVIKNSEFDKLCLSSSMQHFQACDSFLSISQLRCFDTFFSGPHLRFLNDFLVDFPLWNRREIFTTYWA